MSPPTMPQAPLSLDVGDVAEAEVVEDMAVATLSTTVPTPTATIAPSTHFYRMKLGSFMMRARHLVQGEFRFSWCRWAHREL